MANTPSSRGTIQNAAITGIKGSSANFLNLLRNWKGKTKDATIRASAKGYFQGLNKPLPSLFGPGKRWEQSSLQGKWNHFVQVWNDGDCKWTKAFEAFDPIAEAIKQSE